MCALSPEGYSLGGFCLLKVSLVSFKSGVCLEKPGQVQAQCKIEDNGYSFFCVIYRDVIVICTGMMSWKAASRNACFLLALRRCMILSKSFKPQASGFSFFFSIYIMKTISNNCPGTTECPSLIIPEDSCHARLTFVHHLCLLMHILPGKEKN